MHIQIGKTVRKDKNHGRIMIFSPPYSKELPKDVPTRLSDLSSVFVRLCFESTSAVLVSSDFSTTFLLWAVDFFTSKLNYTKGHIETVGSLQGIWGVENSGAVDLKTDTEEVSKRRRDCVSRSVGETRFMRYSFIVRLNSGVIENHPLPKQVPIKLIFYRADAEKSLLSMKLRK